MAASAEKIISDVKKGQFAPVYFLCGEETHAIDTVEQAILQHALTDPERDFNQDIFYAKDVDDISTVINACKVYPSFANRRLVMLREAQSFNKVKQWESLVAYLEKPTESTVLVISHKHKGVDKRGNLYKSLTKKAELLIAEKLRDYQMPGWIAQHVKGKGFQIDDYSAQLLAENLGNDMPRIVNEVEKLEMALDKGAVINQEIIERYIGISRDYNNLELSNAVQFKNVQKVLKILRYFENNPKAGPSPLIIGTLYSFFIKLWQIHQLPPHLISNDGEIMRIARVPAFLVKDIRQSMRLYPVDKTNKAIAILSEYDAKSKGITPHSGSDYELMLEMVYKLMH